MKTVEERFKEKVNKKGPYPKEDACIEHPEIEGTCCHEWLAGLAYDGYGRFCVGGQTVLAHKYIYEYHYGKVKKGNEVCHKCDNTKCVRLSHLFEGTHEENVHDMKVKDRQVKGEAHSLAKLTEDKVRKIRRWYATGEYALESIGKFFGVDTSTIHAIVSNKGWKHVK